MDERQHLPLRRLSEHSGRDQRSENESSRMNPFTYSRATDENQAVTAISGKPQGKFLGGGTNLIDLMKMGVETPNELVDINRLPLAQIEEIPGKGVRIGALARNSDVAEHELIKTRYPVLSEALLSGASPQLRNMATVGGNLMQRTRCYYFYDPAFPACNKRKPGSGCGAIDGYNRIHAILGQSEQCIATNPSDMCVALAALDAIVRVRGPNGEREIAFADFHRLPGDTPERDTNLGPDELIIAVDLPAMPFAVRSDYLKVRDRASYAFALVSVAAALDLGSNKEINAARLALGGVAHKPWRANAAEKKLIGQEANEKTFRAAAEAELAPAKSYKYNSFKIELAKRAIVRALSTVAEMS
jgi:xanthine dehydrogenase YagS FAD-binding subunit